MAKAEIHAGACGFNTQVEANMNGKSCLLQIESDCTAVQKLAQELVEVDPFNEISFRKQLPRTWEMGVKHCTHAACPVPAGIIKAVEVAAGLNLPLDVSLKLTK